MFSRAAARVSGSSVATGSRSPTSDSASDSRLAAGWARPPRTVIAATRLAGGVGLEPHVAGVEVGPPGLVGPQQDAGVDADGVEPGGEVLADDVGLLAVGGDADDADAGAGLGVAA